MPLSPYNQRPSSPENISSHLILWQDANGGRVHWQYTMNLGRGRKVKHYSLCGDGRTPDVVDAITFMVLFHGESLSSRR